VNKSVYMLYMNTQICTKKGMHFFMHFLDSVCGFCEQGIASSNILGYGMASISIWDGFD